MDDFEAILEEGRRAKRQKKMEKAELAKIANVDAKEAVAKIEPQPREEEEKFENNLEKTSADDNLKMETVEKLTERIKSLEEKTETDSSEILLAIQRGEEVERSSWLKMSQNGEKLAKTTEKVWQMSPSGGSGLRFSLKAVKSDVEASLTCNGCGHVYANRSFLKKHMKRSMCASDSQCSCNCGKTFKARDSLRQHLKKGCDLEKKVMINEEVEAATDKDCNSEVEESRNLTKTEEREEEVKMDIDEEVDGEEIMKEGGNQVTLLREDGVEDILSRYSALLVQDRPKNEQTSPTESEIIPKQPKQEKWPKVESESGKGKRFPPKILSQSKPIGKKQAPMAITADQVIWIIFWIQKFILFLQVCRFLGLHDYPLPMLPSSVTKQQEEFERCNFAKEILLLV